jgi:amino acid permease
LISAILLLIFSLWVSSSPMGTWKGRNFCFSYLTLLLWFVLWITMESYELSRTRFSLQFYASSK